MAIRESVGAGGRNRRSDVIAVQVLLNMNIDRIAPLAPLAVDGAAGERTLAAIEAFQRRVVGLDRPDRRVDPGGATLRRLREGVPEELTPEKLRGVMPAATAADIGRYHAHLVAGMPRRRIDTPLRQAHFLAQIAHESGALRFNEEIASGDAYEGRIDLGNTEPGDGRRFKGRGLIQLTGRANYRRYGEAIGVDLLSGDNHLTVATDPARAVDVACWYWEERDINDLADLDDVRGVTRRINGGLNGLADRRAYLERAKFFMGLS